MRYLEHRRHSMRVQPGQHLNQAGVALARRVGETMGPFALVVTSTLPRAYETAIAMGRQEGTIRGLQFRAIASLRRSLGIEVVPRAAAERVSTAPVAVQARP